MKKQDEIVDYKELAIPGVYAGCIRICAFCKKEILGGDIHTYKEGSKKCIVIIDLNRL